MARVYTNQPVTLDVTFTDQNGDVIDLSGGSVSAELFAPSNRTETASSEISGSISVAASGTATVTVPADTLDEAGEWRIQAIATLSSTEWPAEVTSLVVYQRGSLN